MVTAPRPGARTLNDTIAVRGFLCQDYHLVLVRNKTTDRTILTNTDALCDREGCIYTFATFMNDLALGENELAAVVPDQDPPVEVRITVLRTALAGR